MDNRKVLNKAIGIVVAWVIVACGAVACQFLFGKPSTAEAFGFDPMQIVLPLLVIFGIVQTIGIART